MDQQTLDSIAGLSLEERHAIVVAWLDTLTTIYEQKAMVHAALHAACERLLAEPYGCVFCDSGVLRNPAKGHENDCGYLLARAALADE